MILMSFYLSAGIMIYAGITTMLMASTSNEKRTYQLFSLVCLTVSFYQIFSAQYVNAYNISSAISAIKWQMNSIVWSFPCFYLFVSHFCKQKISKPILTLLVVACSALTILNMITPYSLRFEEVKNLSYFSMLGEPIAHLEATGSGNRFLTHLISVPLAIWALLKMLTIAKKGNYQGALIFAFSLLLMLLSAWHAALIDSGKLHGIYCTGFAFTLIVLMFSLHMANNAKQQLKQMSRQMQALKKERIKRDLFRDERDHYISALKQVAKGVSSNCGRQFYETMATQLADLLNASTVSIGLVEKDELGDPFAIRTQALFCNGEIKPNVTFHLSGTPNATIIQKGMRVYPRQIQALFPNDKRLAKMKFEGYAGIPILSDQNEVIGLISIYNTSTLHLNESHRDILEIFAARAGAELLRNQAEHTIRQMAYEDYLTQLPNRALSFEQLKTEIFHLREGQQQGAFYLIDMDNFKHINDALGHDIGDDILRMVGQRLRHSLCDKLFVSRLGGDEFAVIDREGLKTQQLYTLFQLLNEPFRVGNHLIDVSGSIGIALFPLPNDEPLDVLRHAEMALHHAKQERRGTHAVYEQVMEESAKDRLQMQNALKQALYNNELSINLQPQICADGSYFGAEVLVRWIDKDLGFISPAKFIPIAEECGLIHAVGEWVMREALRCLKLWQAMGLNIGHLSINVSPWQFALPSFVQDIRRLLEETNTDPSDIMLEVTESGMLNDVDDTINKLYQLQELGVMIALDDFGTGYSSLAYLRDLPLNVLKIDKAFIDELLTTCETPLAESMIAIGCNMDLHVIAEGVEMAEQAQTLAKMGCTIYQGYYFSKPLNVEMFELWLKERQAKAS